MVFYLMLNIVYTVCVGLAMVLFIFYVPILAANVANFIKDNLIRWMPANRPPSE